MPSRELAALEQVGLSCATGETAAQLVQPSAQGMTISAGSGELASNRFSLKTGSWAVRTVNVLSAPGGKGQGTGGLSRKSGWAPGRPKPLGQTYLGLRPRAATYCTCCVTLGKSFNLSELQFPCLLNEDLNTHLQGCHGISK